MNQSCNIYVYEYVSNHIVQFPIISLESLHQKYDIETHFLYCMVEMDSYTLQ